ncbi:MAG: hypothetical protein ACI4II_05255 [Acutalibacteraceae bacterium]
MPSTERHERLLGWIYKQLTVMRSYTTNYDAAGKTCGNVVYTVF